MPRRTLTPAPTAALAVLASIALALLTLGGCGNGKKKVLDPHGLHPPGMSNYQGFFASEGGVGRIGVVTSAPTASGALTLEGGGSISLVGTYDNASDSLHLTGSGYEFGGRVSPVSGSMAVDALLLTRRIPAARRFPGRRARDGRSRRLPFRDGRSFP